MPKLFSEEHELFRDSFRRFLEKEAVPYYAQWEKEREIPRSFWRKLGEQGYLVPWAEERYGGAETDFLYSVVIAEELARVGASLIGVALHNDIVAPYIQSYGTEAQKAAWLPRCISGEAILAVAMTEPGTGSDLASVKTTAIRDGDSYILNGAKTFITNGILADLVVVVCKTDPDAQPPHRGISLIMVERGAPGFTRGRKLEKMGMHSQDTAELFFENCRVPASNLLGEEGKGFYYLMEKLQQERLIVAIQALAETEAMFEETLEYVKTRTAFGQPIGTFQHNAFKMAEMATDIALARNFIENLIRDHIAGQDVISQVSMAKWWVTEMANRAAYQCQQLYGGYGYMEEYPVARHYRDLRVSAIYAGTNEIMKSIIAKNLGLA